MNFLTNKYGQEVDQWNPLSVNDVSISYDKVSISGETVTFVTGAAGFSQSVSLDKAPVMNLLGDRVGSHWREARNLRCSNEYRMADARITGLVETATSATVTIWDPEFNLEQLFESPAATGKFVIVVRDPSGGTLYGFIGGVAASGNSYVLDVYSSPALSTQSWVGTLADFALVANSTQFEIYSNESSISWTTGTILTKEVKFPEHAQNDPQALTQFLDGLANGEYGVDYERGIIHYKKATTGTSDTIAYTSRAATAVTITSGGSSGSADVYTTIAHGSKVVATAGTPEVFGASTTIAKIDIQAYIGNAGNVAIGGSNTVDASATLGTGTGILLEPGDAVTIYTDNLDNLFLDVLSNGDGVRFCYYL